MARPPHHPWLLGRGLRLTAQRARCLWRDLPPHAWKSWLIMLTVGWVLVGLLAYALAYLGERLTSGATFPGERETLARIVAALPLNLATAQYLGVPGDSIFLLVLVLAAALLAIWRGYVLRALTLLIALFWSDVVAAVGWLAWNRARPDFIYEGYAAPPLHSFPSGHVLQAIVVYGFLAYLWIAATRNRLEQLLAGLLALLVAVNTAATRLAMGTHWPSDIVAAVPLGLFWLAFLIIALRRAQAAAGRKV